LSSFGGLPTRGGGGLWTDFTVLFAMKTIYPKDTLAPKAAKENNVLSPYLAF
jgi:hypothetical protein